MSEGNAKLSIERNGIRVFTCLKGSKDDLLPMLAILVNDVAQTMGIPYQMAMTALILAGPVPTTNEVKIDLSGAKRGGAE